MKTIWDIQGPPTNWTTETFSEVISVNPRRVIRKGELVKFISMTDLNENEKKISGFVDRRFSGGSKFKNKDTLMARITPCLENGKTAYVDILNENEIAFGSTEFIVLASKPGKTVDKFVYYLARSPRIRKEAIKSMVGTSGRQRVQSDVFDRIELNLPPLPEQKMIAGVLSSLDDKIDCNRRMNQTLEELAQALFKHWFVDFEFPDESGSPYKSSGGAMEYNETLEKNIPKKWTAEGLGDVSTNLDSKRIPLSSREREKRKGQYPYYGANGVLDYVDDYLFDGVHVLLGEDGTIITDDGYPVLQYVWGKFWVNNHAHILKGEKVSDEFLYLMLRKTNISSIVTGAVQPKINQKNLNSLRFAIPLKDVLDKFNSVIQPQFTIIRNNSGETKNLISIRDSLLPKLMSGKIRVPIEGGT